MAVFDGGFPKCPKCFPKENESAFLENRAIGKLIKCKKIQAANGKLVKCGTKLNRFQFYYSNK
ncbi:MAG: hypothetical protein ACI4LN_04780 [Anaerovoracaceae bacterium]